LSPPPHCPNPEAKVVDQALYPEPFLQGVRSDATVSKEELCGCCTVQFCDGPSDVAGSKPISEKAYDCIACNREYWDRCTDEIQQQIADAIPNRAQTPAINAVNSNIFTGVETICSSGDFVADLWFDSEEALHVHVYLKSKVYCFHYVCKQALRSRDTLTGDTQMSSFSHCTSKHSS
jgi:hypothetical protein